MRLRPVRASALSRIAPTAHAGAQARRRTWVWTYRSLIWNFTQRDLKSRFKGTALGWAWSLVVPLATLLIYSFVFSVIFRAVPPDLGNGDPGIYAVWLFGGLIPWTFLSLSVTMSIPTLLDNGPLLQKVYFPSYAPVLGAIGAILVQTLIESVIYGFVLILLGNVGLSWLVIALWLAIYMVFVAAIAVSLAVINVYYRDVAHLTGVVLQLLFFLTPIIYTIDQVPADWNGIPLQQIVMLNPIAQFVELFRALSYGLEVPPLSAWLGPIAWTAGAFLLAILVFRRWGLDVGETV